MSCMTVEWWGRKPNWCDSSLYEMLKWITISCQCCFYPISKSGSIISVLHLPVQGVSYLNAQCKRFIRISAFPHNGPGTSNGAKPAGHDLVLHAFTCRLHECFTKKKGKGDAGISGCDFWTTRQLKDYLRKKGGRLSGRKSSFVSRQGEGIDARDNVRSVDINSA